MVDSPVVQHDASPNPGPQQAGSADGPVIENRVSGERIVIRTSGAQTNGRLLAFDLSLPAGGHVPAGHTHPKQEERFTVRAGHMRFCLEHQTVLAGPGETVLIPAGTAHWFGNDGLETAHARVEVQPALRMEELLRAAQALGQTAHIPGTPLPSPVDLARFLLEFEPEVAVPRLPSGLARPVLLLLRWLGRRHGAGPRP